MHMVKSKTARKKTDPVAIATKGRVTSQIQTQESSDKSKITETGEDTPRILSVKTET